MGLRPIRVGLVGAGPWAGFVHGPSIAASLDFDLAAVWARRPEAAEALAARHGGRPAASFEALLEACEAVVFAVPPDVQAPLAIQAAKAGKALLLEKPIALDLGSAEALAEAVGASGVPNLLALTWRYSAAVRAFIDEARAMAPIGGRGIFAGGGFLPGSPFATPWRIERGPLLDLGPHVIDLLEVALGPVTAVQAHGDAQGWVGLALDHEGGAHSEASLCANAAVTPHTAGVEVFGRHGMARVDCQAVASPADFVTMYRDFAAAIRGERPAPADARRGLELQRLLAEADTQIRVRRGATSL